MDKKQIELDARLDAIEYMICHTLNMIYRSMNVPQDVISVAEKRSAASFAQLVIPDADAAMSDHVADEIAAAVAAIQRLAQQMRG